MKTITNPYAIAALLIIMAVFVGIVGGFDYEDEVLKAEVYCANVHSGIWPDYEGSYRKECKDGHYKGDR